MSLETLHKIARAPRPGPLLREYLRRLEAQGQAHQLTLLRPNLRAKLLATDYVPCRMGGMLLARACLLIRSRVWPSGRRRGQPIQRACVGCPLGEEYARRLPGFPLPPPSQPAEVLSPAQRQAKARAQNLPWVERQDMDPMREAATLTPDDADEWR